MWWLDVKPHRGIDSEQSKVLNGLCSRLRCTSLDVVGRIKKDAEARAGLQLLQSNPKKKKNIQRSSISNLRHETTFLVSMGNEG